jgi:DNA-binding CsgD family transcriptional regulator
VLLEREEEIAELEELAGRAATAAGTVGVIEGPAGIGKSRLLAAVAERAHGEGIEVLEARGGQLEHELGWGVVRELFAPLVSSPSAESRALFEGAAALSEQLLVPSAEAAEGTSEEPVPDPIAPEAALHSLYWLTSNLAERAPLALLVDDVHWADPASLRWLAYLAARIEDLPVLLLLAVRPEEGEAGGRAMGEIGARARSIPLGPLSEEASSELLATAFGRRPDPPFAQACYEATAGNPFLVRELTLALQRDEISPTAAEAERVGEARPETISRAVLLRLLQLPPVASELVRSLAVLGSEASLAEAAALAGTDQDAAARAADSLASTQILESGLPLRFVHPIVRTVIYEEIPAAVRSRMHERAARVLSEAGADHEVVAVHLLATEPRGDPEVAGILVAAARTDLARGVPESAAAFLRRSLEERASEAGTWELHYLLGVAEGRSGARSAVDTLRQALSDADAPRERALATLELGRALTAAGRLNESIEVMQHEFEQLADKEADIATRLELELLASARLEPETHRMVSERLGRRRSSAGRGEAERQRLAARAFERAWAGASAAEAGELAERALDGGTLLAEEGGESPAFLEDVFTLIACDRFAIARSALEAALEDAGRRGSLLAFCLTSANRCLLSCWGGSVTEAEADGRAAVEAALAHGWRYGPVFSWLMTALIERDRPEEADQVLRSSGVGEQIPDNILFNSLLYGRGCLRLELGDDEAGIDDLIEVGRRLERVGGDRMVSAFAYRSRLALALAPDDPEPARALAAEELALARAFGAPRALGIALQAAGVVESGKRGLELLREAVTVLEASESSAECSRAVVEMGAALRRGGDRAKARELLGRGLDLAHRCGARAIERRAREELQVAGARPRRERIAGPESLTASERRIAEMAASGLRNREIAQQLFVSLRTVETHLTHAYQKLDISSRKELAAALRAG